MRKTYHKWFWVWDYKKEKEWLDRMANEGLALVSVGFCRYDFEPCTPGEYEIHFEFLKDMPGTEEGQRYISFLEESGAEYVGNVARWGYFRTHKGDSAPLSDLDSRIAHFKRLLCVIIALACVNAYNAVLNLVWYLGNGRGMNLFAFILAGVVCGLLVYGAVRINMAKKALEEEHRIFE